MHAAPKPATLGVQWGNCDAGGVVAQPPTWPPEERSFTAQRLMQPINGREGEPQALHVSQASRVHTHHTVGAGPHGDAALRLGRAFKPARSVFALHWLQNRLHPGADAQVRRITKQHKSVITGTRSRTYSDLSLRTRTHAGSSSLIAIVSSYGRRGCPQGGAPAAP